MTTLKTSETLSDPVRSALDRVRRWRAANDGTPGYFERLYAVHPDCHGLYEVNAAHAEDLATLAAAFEKEHLPDTDEPVTEAWLASEGWLHFENGDYLAERWQHPCGLWLWDFNGEYWICSQFDGGPGQVNREFRTRGDVRELLRAAGVR